MVTIRRVEHEQYWQHFLPDRGQGEPPVLRRLLAEGPGAAVEVSDDDAEAIVSYLTVSEGFDRHLLPVSLSDSEYG